MGNRAILNKNSWRIDSRWMTWPETSRRPFYGEPAVGVGLVARGWSSGFSGGEVSHLELYFRSTEPVTATYAYSVVFKCEVRLVAGKTE